MSEEEITDASVVMNEEISEDVKQNMTDSARSHQFISFTVDEPITPKKMRELMGTDTEEHDEAAPADNAKKYEDLKKLEFNFVDGPLDDYPELRGRKWITKDEMEKYHIPLYDPRTNVNHPQHYHPGTYEAINVIEAWDLGFCLGNAVKYISRAGHKGDAVEDLEKAKWYIQREIKNRVVRKDE